MSERVVWKYALAIGPEQTIAFAGRIVHAAVQDSFPMLWVEVDRAGTPVARTFRIFGTGQTIPDGWEHRGTVQDPPFVWHVYERAVS